MESPAPRPDDLNRRLPLQEGLFLLGMRSDKGTMVSGWSSYIIGGALLAELLLRGRIEIEKTRWKTRVIVLDAKTPTRDRMLNECLVKLRDSKLRSVDAWIGRFIRIKKLKHRVAERLCRRGILSATRRSVLFVFKVRAYPEMDARWKREITERLRQVILGDGLDAAGRGDTGRDPIGGHTDAGARLDQRTAMLLSLAEGGGLLRHVLNRKEKKAAKRRIKALVKDEPIGRAVARLIHQAAAAATSASG